MLRADPGGQTVVILHWWARVADPGLRGAGLRELLAEPLDAGWINHYEPYEEVHRENLESVLAATDDGPATI